MSRQEAIKINQDKSGRFPETYLGYPLSEVLKEIDMTRKFYRNMR